jgi:hypothetical protein
LKHHSFAVSAFISSARSAVRAAGWVVLVGSYRIVAASGIAAFAASITGCYTYPARNIVEVAPPAVVAAHISDAGRVALSEPLGSGVSRIDGQVVGKADSGIRLMVTEVRFMNGLANKWQGQELTLRPLDVTSVSQRTFSRQRTVAAMVIGAVAAAALVTVGITGIFSGATGDGKLPGDPPDT